MASALQTTASRTFLIACILLSSFSVRVAQAGDVKTVDDRTVSGQIVSFDGSAIIVETKTEKGEPKRETISLTDVLEIRLTADRPTTRPTTKPVAAKAATREPESDPNDEPQDTEEKSIFAKALDAFGLTRKAAPTPADPDSAATTSTTPTTPAMPTTQQSPLTSAWQLKLVDGEALGGTIRSWSDGMLVLAIKSSNADLKIPTDHVVELWHGSAAQIRKAKAIKIDDANAGQDVAYVMKDADVIAVRGMATGIDASAQELMFRYEGADRKIGLSKLLGVMLASQKGSARSAKRQSAYQQFQLSSGDVLSGRWTELKDGVATLTTFWDQPVTLPAPYISTIAMRNGRVVYLSDLEPSRVEQTPYFDRIIAWRRDASLGGGTIALADGPYPRGIAMHSRCVLEYDLGGTFQGFRARLGFEQPAGESGRAVVRVLADGKPLFDNPDARGTDKPIDLNLDVNGASKLTLIVDFGRDQDAGDRVVFANARLLRAEVGR